MDEGPYEVLGVDRAADQGEIKRRYRQRAKELHPDLNAARPDLAERFRALREAYEVLSDPAARARYDHGEAERRRRARREADRAAGAPPSGRGGGRTEGGNGGPPPGPTVGPLRGRARPRPPARRHPIPGVIRRPDLVHECVRFAILMTASFVYLLLFGLLGAVLRIVP